MKNFEVDKTTNKIRKTKKEIEKQLEESMISDENVNKDIKESDSKVKNSEESVSSPSRNGESHQEYKIQNFTAGYEQGKVFKKFKANENFVNIVNQFGASKSAMVFKIGIVRFLNSYPKIKRY